MRHAKKGNHLGRTKEHRRALMSNMSNSLIEHKRIFTTLAKAKALRTYLEPLVTRAKDNTTHNRRIVFSYLQSKQSIDELFGPVAAEVGERPGGYLRVIRTGFRKGDGAEMAMIEFVDYNKDYNLKEDKPTGGQRRRRRRGKGSGSASAATPTVETANVDDVVAQEDVTGEEPVDDLTDTATQTIPEEAQDAESPAEDLSDETSSEEPAQDTPEEK